MAKRVEPVALSRGLVLRSAAGLADSGGLESLTMRRLAEALGVEAMSLYHHVANKEALLDGLVEVVMAEVDESVAGLDGTGGDWRATMRATILAAREVMLRHPWAPGVFTTRGSASLPVVRYIDRIAGIMRRGGFGQDLIHKALHALGGRALGFAQELFEPGEAAGQGGVASLGPMAAVVPNLVAMLTEVAHDDPGSTLGWCDSQAEFEFGLDLILDGLERHRTT